jgi:hypothetical protein
VTAAPAAGTVRVPCTRELAGVAGAAGVAAGVPAMMDGGTKSLAPSFGVYPVSRTRDTTRSMRPRVAWAAPMVRVRTVSLVTV